jgi:hypothetical protein
MLFWFASRSRSRSRSRAMSRVIPVGCIVVTYIPQNGSTELFHGSVFDVDSTGRQVKSRAVVKASRLEPTSTHVEAEYRGE